jgi:hypothetical protein
LSDLLFSRCSKLFASSAEVTPLGKALTHLWLSHCSPKSTVKCLKHYIEFLPSFKQNFMQSAIF